MARVCAVRGCAQLGGGRREAAWLRALRGRSEEPWLPLSRDLTKAVCLQPVLAHTSALQKRFSLLLRLTRPEQLLGDLPCCPGAAVAVPARAREEGGVTGGAYPEPLSWPLYAHGGAEEQKLWENGGGGEGRLHAHTW